MRHGCSSTLELTRANDMKVCRIIQPCLSQILLQSLSLLQSIEKTHAQIWPLAGEAFVCIPRAPGKVKQDGVLILGRK